MLSSFRACHRPENKLRRKTANKSAARRGGFRAFGWEQLEHRVLLTAAATITWTGGSATSANWSDPANWDLGRAPVNGDSLVFPASASRLANNDDIAGLSVNSITFQGAFTTTTGGYTLGGDDLTVGAGGIADNGNSSSNGGSATVANQIDVNVALAAAQRWSVGSANLLNMAFRDLTVHGNVSTSGFELTTAGSGTIDITGQVSGGGSLFVDGNIDPIAETDSRVVGAPPQSYFGGDGALTLDLDHANTYTGGTNVNNGTVAVSADGALGPEGTNDGGTTVGPNGGVLFNAVAYNTPEAITLDGGELEARGASSFSGPISISGTMADTTTNFGFGAPLDAGILLMGPSAAFTLNGPTLTNDGDGNLLVQGDFYPPTESGAPQALATPGVVINNVISGSGGLTVAAGALALGAANTYQGPTYLVGAATLIVNTNNAIPSASAVVLQSYDSPAFSSIEVGGHADTIGSLAGTQFAGTGNTVDLGDGGSLTLGGDNTSTTFDGNITGFGTLTKAGSGTFDLATTSTYLVTTEVDAGTFLVDGSVLGTDVRVDSATLGGSGTIGGSITVTGGTISPGAGPDPSLDTGTLSTYGDVTLQAFNPPPGSLLPSEAAVFNVQLGGTAAAPTNDRLNVSGSVSLDGVELRLTTLAGAGPFNAGQSFVLIESAKPISGTFAGLPEGSAVSDGTQNFTISYANDFVTLTAQPVASSAVYLNGQAGDGTAATFIQNLYRELLGREPDASGQAYWLNLFAQFSSQGTAAAQRALVGDFVNSAEYREHLIEGMYTSFLHRAADANDLAFWTAELAAGLDEKSVLADILGSQEYFLDAQPRLPELIAITPEMQAEAWVDALYRDLLGRTPDAGGLGFWTQQVSTQDNPSGRSAVAFQFLGAGEVEHKLLNGNYPGAAGSVGAPGSPATGAYALAEITGNGWDNLYFQGNLSVDVVDTLFAQLQAGAYYGETIAGMLDMQQYFA